MDKVKQLKKDLKEMYEGIKKQERKQCLKDVLDLIERNIENYYFSRADVVVKNHREECDKWNSNAFMLETCWDCFGGGTKKTILRWYKKDLKDEIKKLGVE